ncbi:hypothetical protein Y032_0113g391 [Ancylostoma ceylanicum]|uniref:Uncharacterized protein n=1 Tax=Ancylostoma ceylanicum TaxID=53326 RepID=A0A016TDJ9_9BILA|nr:hypothetical protein Y032_0113g391 [Ancylostoma ceylanicum]
MLDVIHELMRVYNVGTDIVQKWRKELYQEPAYSVRDASRRKEDHGAREVKRHRPEINSRDELAEALTLIA